MRLDSIPFAVIDWDQLTESSQVGETGTTSSRTVEVGAARLRLIRFSEDYLADHWCSRGHLAHVLEGAVVIELRDGSEYTITRGMTIQIPSDTHPHRLSSRGGALLLVVD